MRVTLADGTVDTADAAIVTVPIGALRNVDFSPALTSGQQHLVDEGSNSVGFKIWIKIAGQHSIIAGAPGDHPISLLRSEKFLEDEDATILVGFGSDHNAIVLDDIASAQKAINVWRDDLEVIDCGGHDWVADQWSGQTWATLKSGQFFNGWSHFQESSTRLHFAGADFASGWNGVVVDGAIESGIKTARKLIAEFRGIEFADSRAGAVIAPARFVACVAATDCSDHALVAAFPGVSPAIREVSRPPHSLNFRASLLITLLWPHFPACHRPFARCRSVRAGEPDSAAHTAPTSDD